MRKPNLFNSLRFIFFCVLLFSSCKKDDLKISYSPINSGTDLPLYSIKRISKDSLVTCGGRDGKGIILISTDNGNTWNVLNNSFDKIVYDVEFVNSNLGFAACGNFKVYKSNNKGKTWGEVYFDTYPSYPYQDILRKIRFINDSTGFIAGGRDLGKGLIYRTQDGGNHWDYSVYDHELKCVSFSGTNGISCGYGAAISTNDLGNNWLLNKTERESYTGVDQLNNKAVLCGYDGGLFYSDNSGKTWNRSGQSNSLFTDDRYHFNCIHYFNEQLIFAAGYNGLLGKSTDGGKSYTYGHNFDDCAIYDLISINNHQCLAIGNNGKIFKFDF